MTEKKSTGNGAGGSAKEHDRGSPETTEEGSAHAVSSEREAQYKTARAALHELLASPYLLPDETNWLLRVAVKAVEHSQNVERSQFRDYEFDVARSDLATLLVVGGRVPKTRSQHIACHICYEVIQCRNYNYEGDSLIGFPDDGMDEDARKTEEELVGVWSHALALLRGVRDASHKQAKMLLLLFDFVDSIDEDRVDAQKAATWLKEIVEDEPEIVLREPLAMSRYVAAMNAMRTLMRGDQNLETWHALNEFFGAFGIASARAATPAEAARWSTTKRRGYQHPLAKVWQAVKRGAHGDVPDKLKAAWK